MIPWIWLVEGAKTIRGYMESFLPTGFLFLAHLYIILFIDYGSVNMLSYS